MFHYIFLFDFFFFHISLPTTCHAAVFMERGTQKGSHTSRCQPVPVQQCAPQDPLRKTCFSRRASQNKACKRAQLNTTHPEIILRVVTAAPWQERRPPITHDETLQVSLMSNIGHHLIIRMLNNAVNGRHIHNKHTHTPTQTHRHKHIHTVVLSFLSVKGSCKALPAYCFQLSFRCDDDL